MTSYIFTQKSNFYTELIKKKKVGHVAPNMESTQRSTLKHKDVAPHWIYVNYRKSSQIAQKQQVIMALIIGLLGWR